MSNTEPPIIVVKLGGATLESPSAMEAFWSDVSALNEEARLVIVHGGGAQSTSLANRLGHDPRMVDGRRVTTALDLKIAHWSLCGAVNTEMVAQAQALSLPALGLSGADDGMVRVTRRPPWQVNGEEVDFGWVGDVEEVSTDLIGHLVAQDFLPIVAPLGIDEEGNTYNVNADTVACALAKALGAEELLLVTNAGAVRREPDRPDASLAQCTAATFQAGTDDGWIQGGMLVKLKVAFDALEAGVREVFILGPDDLVTRSRGTQVM